MGEGDEWIVAGAGKKSWKRRQGKGWSGANASQRQKCHNNKVLTDAHSAAEKYVWNPAVLDEDVDEKKVAKLMERTCSAQTIMRESRFCAQFRRMLDSENNQSEAAGSGISTLLSMLSTVEEIVVYGLGSLENGPPACKYQFALAGLLADEVFSNNRRRAMQEEEGKAFFFDPAFTAYDRKVIESNRDHRFIVMRENEQCARSTSKPTLFYMPHCEAELYDSLLRSNWNESQLSNLIILGNSFATYKLRWGLSSEHKPKVSAEYPMLGSAAECACEVPVSDCNFVELSAVNDMSFHCFPKEAIQGKLFDEKCC